MDNEREGFTFDAMHFDFNGPLKFWYIARKALAQTPIQFRVAGLPQLVAGVDAGEIEVTLAEVEFDFG